MDTKRSITTCTVPVQCEYGLTEDTKWNTLYPTHHIHLNVRQSCIRTISFKIFNFQGSTYTEYVQFYA
jgi:hypothetical protein